MPRYWLSCLSRQRFEADQGIDFSVDGYREREFRRVLQIEPEDRLVYYIKGLAVFAAICEAQGRCYVNWGHIWQDNIYPCRFERRPLLVLPQGRMLKVKTLLPRLSFLRPPHWGLSLGWGLREIPEQDFKLIEAEMRRLAEGV